MHTILEFLVGSHHLVDRACLWTFVTAIASVISALAVCGALWIAWRQLRSINKTTRADFLHRFAESFFNSESHKLLVLFDYGILTFKKQTLVGKGKEYVYFETNKGNVPAYLMGGSVTFVDDIKAFYSVHEVDQLLGYLEDIGNYEKEGLLDEQMVYEGFGSYIIIAWQNEEMQKYINYERACHGKDMYDGFESVYKKIIALEIKKNNSPS